MSETQVQATPAKSKTEYTTVKMEDGSDFDFPGTRQVSKSYEINEQTGLVTATFRYRNGRVLKLASDQLTRETQLTSLGHGLVQKVGDNGAGLKDIDDLVLSGEEMIHQLVNEGWAAPAVAGDSLAGASIIIKALVETSGLTVDGVKAYLDKRLAAAKDKGEKLSRQELYASFRNPASKTGAVIKRLEDEKASKSTKVSADDELAAMQAAATA